MLLSIIGIMIFSTLGVDAGAVSVATVGVLSYERSIYENLVKQYGEKKSIQFSNLRIEKELTNSNGTYEFNLRDLNTLQANERGLSTNDLFVATRIGMFLIREDSDRLGVAILQSYPNVIAFPDGSGFTLADMETIYNGGLEIKTNVTVNAEFIPGYMFRTVPVSQETSTIKHSQFDINDMTYQLPTLYKFFGNKTVNIRYNFPSLSSMQIAAVASGYKHKLVFMPFGFLIKDGAL